MRRDDLQAFTVVNLGSGGDEPFPLPVWAREGSTLVQVDGADSPSATAGNFARRVSLTDIIAGSTGTRQFTTRAFVSVSGLAEPRADVVRKYGVQDEVRPVDRRSVQTRTLPSVLADHGIEHVDLLKTDLEGIDLEVLLASGDHLDGALCVKCELRFEPFFEGEPRIDEAMGALDDHGFDLLSLATETWQPVSPQRTALVHPRDGQTVWADCIFTRRLAADDVVGRARQVVLLSGLRQRSVAAHLLHSIEPDIDDEIHRMLEPLVRPPEPPSWARTVGRSAKSLAAALAGRSR